MLPVAAALLVLAGSSTAGGTLESLRVSSIEDLEACYAIQPYMLEQQHGEKKTTRLVEAQEIQEGCTAKAVELAKGKSKDPAALKALAEQVRRGHRAEASLKVFLVAVEADATKGSCVDAELDSALQAALSHPADTPSKKDSDVALALQVVGACLANKQFKADIQEELEQGKSPLPENLCPFLKLKKVVASCK